VPTVVGKASTGDPVFEVRGVRLILRPGATHFNRAISCSKCGRDVPGGAVLSPADLDLTPNPVICKNCVRTAGTELFAAEDRPPLGPPAQTPAAPAVSGPETEQEPAPSADADRLAALEHGLADLATLITSAPTSAGPFDEPAAESGEARLEALERRLGEAIEGLRARGETERSELLAVLEGTSRRIDYVGERLAEQSQSVSAQVRDLEERLQRLQVTVDTGPGPAQSHGGAPEQAKVDLERVETRLNERLEGLAAGVVSQRTELQAVLQEEMRQRLDQLEQGVAQATGTGGPSLHALEKRIEETVERLTERAEVQAELRVALEGRVDELSAALRGGTGSAVGDPVRIASEDEAQRREQEALRRRFDEVVDRVQQLQASVEGDRGRAESDSAALAQANVELARVEEQINERFDRLAEKVARADDTQAEHRRSLEEQVEDGLGRITAALESHRQELQAGLREGLAVVQAVAPTGGSASDSRLEALEERLEKSDYEVSELGELHAALDVGLGALRTEIGEVRSAVKKVTEEHADIQDRLDGLNRPPQAAAPGDSARGWKPGRKAETGANLAVAIESAEILAREHQQLKAQVANLEKAAEAATAAAARASSQASTSGPLRSDVRLLQEQLAEQTEALAALSRSVERLRRKVASPAAAETEPVPVPVAKATRKAATTKSATKAAKSAKAAAPARKVPKPR
jgi:chromosome segregation ATPase